MRGGADVSRVSTGAADWFGMAYSGYRLEGNDLVGTNTYSYDYSGIAIYSALVLAVIGWFVLYSAARDINVQLVVGNRLQQECGKSYMEQETARYRLYNHYNDKISKTLALIKKMLMIAFILVIIGVIWLVGQRWWPLGLNGEIRSVMTSTKRKTVQLVVGLTVIVVVSLFVVYYVLNKRTSLENSYSGSAKKSTAITAAFLTIILVGLAVLLGIVFWLNSLVEEKLGISNKNYVPFFAIVVLAIVMASMYAVNIGIDKINDGFISPYGTNVADINKSIKDLKDENCGSNSAGCIIETGPDSGITVPEWMKLTLARNIKRMNPDEKGDPMLLLNSSDAKGNKYADTLYGYIENDQGRELAEIPNTNEAIKRKKDSIRQRMWENRRNNDAMLKPVKTFVYNVYAVVFIITIAITFLLFHEFYANFPTGATYFFVVRAFVFLLIVAILCWLMVSVVYR